jgi:hypothetical protein
MAIGYEHDRDDRHDSGRDHRFAQLHEHERDDRDLDRGDRERFDQAKASPGT